MSFSHRPITHEKNNRVAVKGIGWGKGACPMEPMKDTIKFRFMFIKSLMVDSYDFMNIKLNLSVS